MSRYEIYALKDDKAVLVHRCTEGITESNQRLRECVPGSHQVSVSSSGAVAITGWATGTSPEQRSQVTRSIASRTHAAFARPAAPSQLDDSDDDEQDEPEEIEEKDEDESESDESDEESDDESDEDEAEAPPAPARKRPAPKAPARAASAPTAKVEQAYGGQKGKQLTWRGQTRNVMGWATLWGASVVSINTRLRKGESFAQIAERYADKTPASAARDIIAEITNTASVPSANAKRGWGRSFEWQGQSLSISEWSKRWGVDPSGVNTRLRKGETFEAVAARYDTNTAKPAPYAPRAEASTATKKQVAPKARETPVKTAAEPALTHTQPKGVQGGVGGLGELAQLNEALTRWGSLAELLSAADNWRRVRELVIVNP